jgi:hypothetical protein
LRSPASFKKALMFSDMGRMSGAWMRGGPMAWSRLWSSSCEVVADVHTYRTAA